MRSLAISSSGPGRFGVLLGLWSAVASGADVHRRLALMGTSLEVSVQAASREAGLEASERAIRAIERTEARLSTWRGDSELSRLNRTPVGEAVALGATTAAELELALACAREMGGAFDPTVGALVRAWDLRGEGRIPGALELERALAATGHEHLQLTDGGQAVRLRPVAVEEGGFGKGAALARAREALLQAQVESASLDLGGQVLAMGQELWVPLAHPAHRDVPVLELLLADASMSTSGNSERRKLIGGTPVGHLLDPRTGRPAPFEGSVTVVTADAQRADCLSTALFVLGPEAALAFAERHPEVQAIVLEEKDGALKVRASAGLEPRLRRVDVRGEPP